MNLIIKVAATLINRHNHKILLIYCTMNMGFKVKYKLKIEKPKKEVNRIYYQTQAKNYQAQ